MVLLVPGAILIGDKLANWHQRCRFDDEVDDVSCRDPLSQVVRQGAFMRQASIDRVRRFGIGLI